jgi:hypothetical protein
MKAKRIFTALLAVVFVLSFTAEVFAVAATFTDVPESHPYKAAIEFCAAKGIVKGVGANTFLPDAKLTRAQFATLWCRSLSLKEENPDFTDITKQKNYYDSPAIVLRSLGILNGTSTTKFSPDEYVTREQLASLTQRSYRLGVINADDYKKYTDFASISGWAQAGISACINGKVFEGLYDGQTFKPGDLVTRGEVCKLIYNISSPAHTVTIGALTGGTITASPASARAGTTITLTITPAAGKQLKAGTLKYDVTPITGTTFTMPEKDIIITAEFEDIPVTLESITITSEPTKKTYVVGQALDLTGLVVTANYSNDIHTAVLSYTTTPAGASILSTAGAITVTASYTEGTITKTATFTVQVTAT